MKRMTAVSTLSLLLSVMSYGQTKKDLNIDFMLPGSIYVKSSIKDSTAIGGFWTSPNLPKKITDENTFPESGLFLKIDTTKTEVLDDQFNAYKFYIGNKSDTIVNLEASDSRLYVIAEVFYENKWMPIEYLSSSWCGNSYHKVFLTRNEYWEFVVPKFSGKIATRLRYRLMIDDDQFIYSNEILTRINKSQMEKKQGK